MAISIRVLFFASAREAAGTTSTTVELDDAADTEALREKLAALYPRLAGLVKDEDNITLALNEEYVQMGEAPRLKNGDTVALIPPISGG
ncbi:hypothetical protein THAOC_28843 [Thalassiosira oceanica]|uniref:Molybdopterin synthase sulfur carrier subunit n=1 Tax=Thalassiosira oceanica TaxID=159749 RepID=K0RDW2_THAOC|nr:hypothetical protein THAOC_28843 [Thalassiosira oceanica]|mmetsp:Transcript_9128/g.21194  ORF Transcript_9128/g.21194 Transcript_9128/m.21194 type:complete len:89 (+) Transcript_9128:229-495(+)|eukprot:EJK51938.1 hypothetical protein THAOC_28843 [Thalassiosira oceanica]